MSEGLSDFSPAPTPEELARLDPNDWGNAMRLCRLAGAVFGAGGLVDATHSRLLFLTGSGWVGFNGRFWDRRHGEALAQRLAHEVARGLWVQAECLTEKADRKTFRDFAKDSGNAGRTANMLRQAQPYLSVELAAFDADPLKLNVENGTLRLRREPGDGLSVTLLPHDPADRITRMAACAYDASANAPTWAACLREWHPTERMRAYLRRRSGYAVTGLVREQVMFVDQGRGRDGKSTFNGALREVLGTYANICDVRTFLDAGPRGGADASPDLARLSGDVRFVSMAEPPRGAKLNEGLIKSWTSGAPIVARELRQAPIEFLPIGKIVLECNSRPVVRGDDDGVWRRIVLCPWTKQVPLDQIDRTLPEQLRAEAAGILNWLIAGVGDYLSEGLRDPPPEVLEAMDDYRKSSSPFGEWFAEACTPDPSARVLATDLYASYTAWCEANGQEPMKQRSFGDALGDRQVIRAGKDGRGKVLRRGARLNAQAPITYAPDQDGYGVEFE